MLKNLHDFVQRIPSFSKTTVSKQCDYFIYYLTAHEGKQGVGPQDLLKCFAHLKLHTPSNIYRYLSSNSNKTSASKPKFIKQNDKYHLEFSYRSKIEHEVGQDKPALEVSATLRSLLPKLKNVSEKEFLSEAIKCFEIEAYRAAVVMVWLLTIDHLYEHVLNSKLTDFNQELAKVTDKRVKVKEVKTKDDFGDIPEGIFIILCRASQTISNDVRKILEDKLGTRNSAAHPSTVQIGKGKAYDFIEDLVNNVIRKY